MSTLWEVTDKIRRNLVRIFSRIIISLSSEMGPSLKILHSWLLKIACSSCSPNGWHYLTSTWPEVRYSLGIIRVPRGSLSTLPHSRLAEALYEKLVGSRFIHDSQRRLSSTLHHFLLFRDIDLYPSKWIPERHFADVSPWSQYAIPRSIPCSAHSSLDLIFCLHLLARGITLGASQW